MEKHPVKKHLKALISVYHKEKIGPLVEVLHSLGIEIVSTGGTMKYINGMGIPVRSVEELTGYPSILGGRVKSLHPVIFGGILGRPGLEADDRDIQHYDIEAIDIVVVDLYPFEAAIAGGASHNELIEQIDIGGISLIRAAAKNFEHVLVVPSAEQFEEVSSLLRQQHGSTSIQDRRRMAALAFHMSSHLDTSIFNYLNDGEIKTFKQSINEVHLLRYGENPHQQGSFFGRLDEVFDKLNGKAVSYNNLLDIDAAMALMAEFSAPTFAIIKHSNVCGIATRDSIEDAWEEALAGDPVSAFGGVLITNRHISNDVAAAINELFFEVLIAPSYEEKSLALLRSKKNRILLRSKSFLMPDEQYRSVLNGVLWQTPDHKNSIPEQWKIPTQRKPSSDEEKDLVFANSVVKHLKSNAIAVVKDLMLIGAGAGQTSRIDALKHAIEKAGALGHALEDAVMASDAFFPFPDSVELAHNAGITAVIQPGGSVRDQESVDFCDASGMTMAFTGNRHFKH
jgi:phosphoribosylaminoimidazolecarboxamide formyltransferase / IMP cyclohydrolase